MIITQSIIINITVQCTYTFLIEQSWNMSGNDFDEADASMDGQLNYFAKESTTSVKMTN